MKCDCKTAWKQSAGLRNLKGYRAIQKLKRKGKLLVHKTALFTNTLLLGVNSLATVEKKLGKCFKINVKISSNICM